MPVDPIVAQLARRRRQLRVSQATVERAMGYSVHHCNLGRIERGERVPSVEFVRRWAEVLGCLVVLVPLDEDGELDHDPEPPGELLTPTQRRERLLKLAATTAPAYEVARRTGVSERTVYRHRESTRTTP